MTVGEMNKKQIRAEYKKAKAEDHPMQTCKKCKQRDMKKNMEPHHPKGRHGLNMLLYFWVHPQCHRWIHDNPEDATNLGLLISGRNT